MISTRITCVRSCLFKNLNGLSPTMLRFNYVNYSRYVKAAEERLSPLAYCMSNKSSKSRAEPKLSPITSTGSSISRSSKSSRLKELKISVELKRLKAQQALELANYEAEMEKKKIDIKMQNRKQQRKWYLKLSWRLEKSPFLLKRKVMQSRVP